MSIIRYDCDECGHTLEAEGSTRDDYYTYECAACDHSGEVIGYWQDRQTDQAIDAAQDARLTR